MTTQLCTYFCGYAFAFNTYIRPFHTTSDLLADITTSSWGNEFFSQIYSFNLFNWTCLARRRRAWIPDVILLVLLSKVILLVLLSNFAQCALRIALCTLQPRSTDSLGTQHQNLNVTLIEWHQVFTPYMVVAREWHSMVKYEILSNFSGQTSFLWGIDIQKGTGLTTMQSKGEVLK